MSRPCRAIKAGHLNYGQYLKITHDIKLKLRDIDRVNYTPVIAPTFIIIKLNHGRMWNKH